MYDNNCYDTTFYDVSGAAADNRKPAAKSTESFKQGYRDITFPDNRSGCRKDFAIKVLGVACLVCLSTITATIVLHFLHRSQWIEASAVQEQRLSTISSKFTEEIDLLRRSQNKTSEVQEQRLSTISSKFTNEIDLLRRSQNENSVNHDQRLENVSNETRKNVTILQEKIHDFQLLGNIFNPGDSCHQIKQWYTNVTDGLYYMKDPEGNVFQTFCDMRTAGGGWTLVASIHENNMKGKCTTGDRWSSEQGNNPTHPHGDGFWENRAIHGSATSASSDDYKNSGYFAMNASDIMIWQVPNDTPVSKYKSSAFLRYRTTAGFLSLYGGNMASLFSVYKIRSKQYSMGTDDGPSVPIVWDIGDNTKLLAMYGYRAKQQVIAGYVQFRVINWERDAYALCPGVKARPGYGDIEHSCIGGTSDSPHVGHCGDYGFREDPNPGYSLSKEMIESVVMIFYK